MRSSPHTFGWDEEPADERPSEFMPTGFHTLSGYHVPRDLTVRYRKRDSRIGFGGVVVAFVLFLGLSSLVIHEFGRMVRF